MASLARQQPQIIQNLIFIKRNNKTVEINHFKKKEKNEFKKKKPTATLINIAKLELDYLRPLTDKSKMSKNSERL